MADALLDRHAVNLRQGQFSTGGADSTSPEDVDRIFAEHIPAFARELGVPQADVPIVLYAHGGLVSEAAGLNGVRAQVRWWRSNGVYPVFFVWESGLADAILGFLHPLAGQAALGETLANRAIEKLLRRPGGLIWGGMKRSAELASSENGAARYVARQLAAYCAATPGVRLHAVGHSAGSIFHAHLLQAANKLGVPAFAGVELMAPAVRVDAYRSLLEPLLGAYVRSLAIFALAERLEEADDCARIYRRSLLCLVSAALEAQENTPILGLETSLAADRQIQDLIARGGIDLVLSSSPHGPDGSRSTATTHGGFDNDPATMESVAFRVLGRAPSPFPPPTGIAAEVWGGPTLPSAFTAELGVASP